MASLSEASFTVESHEQKLPTLPFPVVDMEKVRQEFVDQGYSVIRHILPADILQAARQDIAVLVDDIAERLLCSGRIDNLYKDEPFERRLFKLFRSNTSDAPKIFKNELHTTGMYDLFFYKPILNIVERLLDTSELRIFPNYAIRPKLPETEQHEVPWHQDTAYSYFTNWFASTQVPVQEAIRTTSHMVNVWTPLVPATRQNGCMQFIPKSHLQGLLPHEETDHYLKITDTAMEELLPSAVDIELSPGDIVLFSQLMVHRGLPNDSDHIRWSSDFRYQDAALPTLRNEAGHLARSLVSADKVVRDAIHWTKLSLGGPNEPTRKRR